MKKFSLIVVLCTMASLAAGCAASSTTENRALAAREDSREVASAIESVMGAVTGEKVDDQKLREISKKAQTDPETREAVQAVAEGLSGSPAHIKYCPVDGKRFSSQIADCPEHQVPLKFPDE